MSKISLSGNASGTGTLTIAAPNTNSNYQLDLPTSSGTMVVTGGAQTIEFGAGSASTPSITFTGDTNTGIFSPTADTVGIATGGSERMRINSSGNLGLGVTPDSTGAGIVQMTIGVAGSEIYSNGAATNMGVLSNAYYNGGWKFAGTGYAARYLMNAGVHEFDVSSASGTAGNAITFTQVLAVEKAKSLALEGATSQSGTGITFPATQSASTDANTLDDYEEGTWTPNVSNAYNSAPTVSYTAQSGSYTKIGRLVVAAFFIDISTFSGGTGPIFFGGLPFTPATTTDARFQGTVYLSGPNTPASTVTVTLGYAKLDNGNYYLCFACSRDDTAMANAGTIQCSDLAGGDVLAGTFTYFV